MKSTQIIPHKILTLHQLQQQVARLRFLKKTIAFTNGCFDILHLGHVTSLCQAAEQADFLIVGVNSDNSTRKLKGPQRPINDEQSRAMLLASLVMVDWVTIFDEETPLELICSVLPDVLVKGGDYTIDQIVGAKEVIAAGGRVVINPIVKGYSTTGLIEKIHSI